MTCKKKTRKKKETGGTGNYLIKDGKNRAGKEDIHEAKVVTSFPTNPQANKLNSTFAESPVSFCPSRHEADGQEVGGGESFWREKTKMRGMSETWN